MREEERLVLEFYILEPRLEKAVPHDRQNKQTNKMKGGRGRNQGRELSYS